MTRASSSDRDRTWQRMVALVMDGRWDWRLKMSEAAGLPFSRVRALDRLTRGPQTLRALADLIGTDAPAATVIVNDLEARGFVVREPHPDDKRAKVVSLTPEGRKVMRAARAVTDEAPAPFEALTAGEVAELRRIIDKLGVETAKAPCGFGAGERRR
jgi:DNA-binding MarR family transcriptional regulator